jgi:hypothetical protein
LIVLSVGGLVDREQAGGKRADGPVLHDGGAFREKRAPRAAQDQDVAITLEMAVGAQPPGRVEDEGPAPTVGTRDPNGLAYERRPKGQARR